MIGSSHLVGMIHGATNPSKGHRDTGVAQTKSALLGLVGSGLSPPLLKLVFLCPWEVSRSNQRLCCLAK